MPHLLRQIILVFVMALAAVQPALAADRLRLAIQKTGTLAWELDIMKARGLDKSAGIELEITELASPEAGKIALRGGSADVIVTDWLFVSRERSLGANFVFTPYSSTIGSVMVPAGSSIASISDLRGRKLGVAGGAIDKSWLLLRGYAKAQGVDLRNETILNFAAPPLLAEKVQQGEMDAVLDFWNFCAVLEGRGFKTLVSIDEVEKSLGTKGSVAMLGYVFDGDFGAKNINTISRFLKISRQAKEILANEPAEWTRLGPRIGTRDEAMLAIYRRRYVEGIPRRPVSEEEADARALFKILAETGGAELVGTARELDPGTYYKAGTGS